MDQSKVVITLMAQHFKLSQQDSPKIDEKVSYMMMTYANAVGSLVFYMICTRLDLAYAMITVSIYIRKSRKLHWEAMKWIFRYVKRTSEVGFCMHDIKAMMM